MVLKDDFPRGACLRVNMAAFIGHGGQFVITISQAGGAKWKIQRQIRCANCQIQMVARLEIRKIAGEAVWPQRRNAHAGGSSQIGRDLCGGEARRQGAQMEVHLIARHHRGILGRHSVRALQSWDWR